MNHWKIWSLALAAVPLLLGGPGCGSDVEVAVSRAPTYASRGTSVSVLGVFKNGRMDEGEFEQWRGAISAALSAKDCAAAFGETMEKAAPDLFSAFDEETRNDGITVDAFEKLAPHARGSVILLVEVFGTPAHKKKRSSEDQTNPAQAPAYSGRGRRGMRMPASEAAEAPRDMFELAASVYSIRGREEVAAVDVKATPEKTDEATAEFTEKLRALLGGSTCGDWSWEKGSEGASDAPNEAPAATP